MALEQIHPMRAQSFDILSSPTDQWQDPEWVWEIKEDGERAVLHVLDGYVGMTGRRISDVTGLLPEKHEYVPGITGFDIPELHGTLIDGELLHPSGDFDLLRSIMGSGTADRAVSIQLREGRLGFVAFDIIKFRGRDISHLPFQVRRGYLELAIAAYRKYTHSIRLVEQFKSEDYDIEELFHAVVAGGGEGLMRKRKMGTYKLCAGSQKSADVLKAKKLLTFDGIVSGYAYGKGKYNKHLIAKLEFSQYKDGVLIKRGVFDGFKAQTLTDMTANIDKYMGRVVEVKCNEVLKSGSLRHPKFSRWRDDKPKEQCTWEG